MSHLFARFQSRLTDLARSWELAGLTKANLPLDAITVESPRGSSHGDLATNMALVLAKAARTHPRELAAKIATEVGSWPEVESHSVAGPGFVNMRLRPEVWLKELRTILEEGQNYGNSLVGEGQKVNVEYVSANPTGPLHIGHARGAVVGDALSALLEKCGYEVAREYYVNDAGNQVEALARSLHLRYREAFGQKVTIDEGLYPGDYLKEVALALKKRDGKTWLEKPESHWLEPLRSFAVEHLLETIKTQLARLSIRQQFRSEKALVDAGKVKSLIDSLEKQSLVYEGTLPPPKGKADKGWEPRSQKLFRSSDFGDSQDRPLQKPDGTFTYFASDMAYHLDKFERGARLMVDVWGSEHDGHVRRMKIAVDRITGSQARLKVVLCNLVKILRNGKVVKMSKRAGTFLELEALLDEVGPDVVRFIMLTRRNEAPLDFDLSQVQSASKDNPVFYVQYAHARCESSRRASMEKFKGDPQWEALWKTNSMADTEGLDITPLLDCEDDLRLAKKLALWPRVVESAARTLEAHRLAFYLYELASEFHARWHLGNENERLRFLVSDDPKLSLARLSLVAATRWVLRSGLAVLGVKPMESM